MDFIDGIPPVRLQKHLVSFCWIQHPPVLVDRCFRAVAATARQSLISVCLNGMQLPEWGHMLMFQTTVALITDCLVWTVECTIGQTWFVVTEECQHHHQKLVQFAKC